jgi:hypothetical protein
VANGGDERGAGDSNATLDAADGRWATEAEACARARAQHRVVARDRTSGRRGSAAARIGRGTAARIGVTCST